MSPWQSTPRPGVLSDPWPLAVCRRPADFEMKRNDEGRRESRVGVTPTCWHWSIVSRAAAVVTTSTCVTTRNNEPRRYSDSWIKCLLALMKKNFSFQRTSIPVLLLTIAFLKETYDFVAENILLTWRILFSMDINSSSTNIDHSEGIQSIKKIFHKYSNSQWSEKKLLQLLEINLRNDSEFNGKFFPPELSHGEETYSCLWYCFLWPNGIKRH